MNFDRYGIQLYPEKPAFLNDFCFMVRDLTCRFRERYDPEVSKAHKAETEQIYKRNLELFVEDLQNGRFQDITFDQPTGEEMESAAKTGNLF